MHRMTPSNTANRSYTAGGARTLIDKINDKGTMQSTKDNTGMHSEKFPSVEAPQNYGFTSNVHEAEKDKDGKIISSAEAFMSFPGGNRSFGYVGVMDDPRHRVKELAPGDNCQYRGKDDRQQMHMSKDGNYYTSRNDRVQRLALVDPPKDDKKQEQAPAGGQQQAKGGGDDKDAAGNKKPKGQKLATDDNKKSEIALEQNGKETYSRHGEYYNSVRGGSDSSVYHKDRKISSQATDKHVHMRFKDMAKIWVDEDGHWSEGPIMQKKDKHCKE
jgi:phage gp45-like